MTKRSLPPSFSLTSLSRTPATHALTRADPRGFSTMQGTWRTEELYPMY
jgi:hypothetical protein